MELVTWSDGSLEVFSWPQARNAQTVAILMWWIGLAAAMQCVMFGIVAVVLVVVEGCGREFHGNQTPKAPLAKQTTVLC